MRVVLAVLLLSSLARAAVAADPVPPVLLELNKLEPLPAAAAGGPSAGCRAYAVASNQEGAEALDALRLDLVLFGTDGIIARRIALDLGPLPPGRTQVRLFDLRDLSCDGVGVVLVNDVISCRIAGTDRQDCLGRLRTASRASAKLTK